MSQESARLVASEQNGHQNGGRSKSSHKDAAKKAPNPGYSMELGETVSEFDDHAPLLSGDFVKSVVFGGLDGLITILAIISGAAGGEFSWHVVLVMGFSTIAANALSMGAGEYLSSKAHREFIQAEKRRELWEFKHFKDVETKEMVKRFVSRGMGKADAELCVAKMAQYEGFFVNLMVTEELGLQLPEDDDAVLLTDAFIMATAFAGFGCLPLVVYCFGQWDIADDKNMFYAALCISAFFVFVLGSTKSSFSSVFWVYSGLETLLVAAASAGVAYGIGSVIVKIIA